ncbi:hypothetical protein BDN70DRAFT_900256 [Pholiota conissans]|uniref:Uncharacterized protein n=1 Tax=Pholiota conissans TaxID=109636 RepID=A0A9P6CU60_9AGAR|nr:hypothetical protein BDN70DRAFT_900256 [Pholiota conissans]
MQGNAVQASPTRDQQDRKRSRQKEKTYRYYDAQASLQARKAGRFIAGSRELRLEALEEAMERNIYSNVREATERKRFTLTFGGEPAHGGGLRDLLRSQSIVSNVPCLANPCRAKNGSLNPPPWAGSPPNVRVNLLRSVASRTLELGHPGRQTLERRNISHSTLLVPYFFAPYYRLDRLTPSYCRRFIAKLWPSPTVVFRYIVRAAAPDLFGAIREILRDRTFDLVVHPWPSDFHPVERLLTDDSLCAWRTMPSAWMFSYPVPAQEF